MAAGDVWGNSWAASWGISWRQAEAPPEPPPSDERNAGGWLSLPDYTRGRDEYVRRQRVALGILPPEPAAEQPAAAVVIPEAVKAEARRQQGVRMSSEQREAKLSAALAREMDEFKQEYAAQYAAALYAELYRLDKQRREDDLIVAMLAA